MITVAGFNTSLDKSLEADELRLGAVNRVCDVRSYPGGKGLHVALTVAALGEPVRLVGLIDAAHRKLFETSLSARGVEFHGVEMLDPVRTCLAVREAASGRVTEILEPGPEVAAEIRRELCVRFIALARESSLAILSGSLPPGFEDTTYAGLVSSLREAGVRCLVDASGALLRHAVDAGSFLVKPNRTELEELTGRAVTAPADAVDAGLAIVHRGVSVVVASLGSDGAVVIGDGPPYRAWAPMERLVNTVGSGDCLLGGVAVGLARSLPMEDTLRIGVACGTANALSQETGWVRREDVDEVLPQVRTAWMS